jgi:guanylate kinase
MAVRLGKAVDEYGQLSLFDYVLTNYAGRLDEVVDHVRAIITAEKLRVIPRRVELGNA